MTFDRDTGHTHSHYSAHCACDTGRGNPESPAPFADGDEITLTVTQANEDFTGCNHNSPVGLLEGEVARDHLSKEIQPHVRCSELEVGIQGRTQGNLQVIGIIGIYLKGIRCLGLAVILRVDINIEEIALLVGLLWATRHVEIESLSADLNTLLYRGPSCIDAHPEIARETNFGPRHGQTNRSADVTSKAIRGEHQSATSPGQGEPRVILAASSSPVTDKQVHSQQSDLHELGRRALIIIRKRFAHII